MTSEAPRLRGQAPLRGLGGQGTVSRVGSESDGCVSGYLRNLIKKKMSNARINQCVQCVHLMYSHKINLFSQIEQ